MLNYLDDGLFETKLKNKKTVKRLLDKYGTLDNFKQNSTLMEDFEYQFAQGDDVVDEVERERQAMMQAMNSLPKQQRTSLDDGDMNVNANLLKPATGTSIFDTENGPMTPIKYMVNYPNKPMPPLEYFIEYNKQYANNQLTPTMRDTSMGNNINKSVFNQDDFINKTMRPIIEDNEGIEPYPYLDSVGLMTIGVGANIDENPLSMDWYYLNTETGEMRHLDKENPDDLMLINSELLKLEQEKEKLPYNKEKRSRENNYRTKYYKDKTNLRVSDDFLNRLYYKRAKEAVNNIQSTINRYNKDPKKKKDIPDFHKLPNPLQIVLMDMMYNMGQIRFDYIVTYDKDGKRRGYPSFWDAVANRDVDAMIRESARNGLGDRNDEIKNFLRKLYRIKY